MEDAVVDRASKRITVGSLTAARENARMIRDQISSEMWEQINRYYLMVSNRGGQLRSSRDAFNFYGEVKLLSRRRAPAISTMATGSSSASRTLRRSASGVNGFGRKLDPC